MSEEKEGPDFGLEGVGAGVDAAAIALALGSASRSRADRFLEEQTGLAADQRHHLHEGLKQVGLKLWELRIGVALRVATLIIGLALATGAGLMVWEAAHSAGLIIEPFAVPPEMAARGLSGQVVATQMLDKLSALQDSTDSSRAPQSYVNNWGDNIKVEIPETGVSIGELQSFLKEWLGHDSHISGEVYRTATGIAVTARVGAEAGTTVTGAETDLDSLMQQAADNIYSRTQPYRYANHLDRNRDPAGLDDRRAHAQEIYEQLIASGDQKERAWAMNGLGSLAAARGQDTRAAIAWYQKATTVWPDFSVGYYAEGFQQRFLDNREAELAAFRNASRLNHGAAPEVHPRLLPTARLASDGEIALLLGDYAEAVRLQQAVVEQRIRFANQNYHSAQAYTLWALAQQHDGGGMRAYQRELDRLGDSVGGNILFMTQGYATLGDWRAIRTMEATARKKTLELVTGGEIPFSLAPMALARAHLGDIKGAEAMISHATPDCDGCLIAHAQIAEMQGQHERADWWFAREEARTPSIPFADEAWGRALLARAKPDAAIEKFAVSNKPGPKFADPLEGWGEALMAKNQSHLALAKFAEADKYAPNWGRLHLKWGEALVYAGKKDEAKAQFDRAAQLDLPPSERIELARHP